MKFKTLKNTLQRSLKGMFIVLLAAGFASCSDDNETTVNASPFDPSKPVVVTSFTPEAGAYQDQIIVYGQNFGTVKDEVTLKIGGKKAVLVNVLGDKMYGYVPSGAFSGEVEVIVEHAGKEYQGKCAKIFNYERKTVVSTLVGYRNETDSQGEIWGPFSEAAGFNAEGCMTFDPLRPNHLYIAYDRGSGFLAELDLENRMSNILMSSSKFQNQRLRNIAFTLDGKYMLVSTDRADNNLKSTSVWIVTRNADGTFNDRSQTQVLAAYKQCNGVAVHPVNGEVYFNSYENGQLFRLEIADYFNALLPDEETGEVPGWTGYKEDGCFSELFRIMDPSYEFNTTIHPTGNYAYLTVINRNYILRTDYDWDKKEFTTPYTIAGSNGQAGWEDAVGTNARVSRPYQGVFVKNPAYAGQEDEYDYYFCDCTNFCVRYITPDGLVRTYAGRSTNSNGNWWGTEDGDLRQAARFRDTTGIAYDEETQTFYILDHNNRSIRTIGQESEETVVVPTPDDEEEGDGDGEQTEEA